MGGHCLSANGSLRFAGTVGGPPLPIRYMGTKRLLAPAVRDAVAPLKPCGRVADLFAGMGSVSAILAPDYPVLANDALKFAASMLRAQFTHGKWTSPATLSRQLWPWFERAHSRLQMEFSSRIQREEAVMRCSAPGPLKAYMCEADHVGNSDAWRRRAKDASLRNGVEHYKLTTLYFSAGYFSTSQAIELDSIRYAIDQYTATNRDELLSAWIAAAATTINAPGHTAQYLKPRSDSSYIRVRRQWRRRVWDIFLGKLESMGKVGTKHWRSKNVVTSADALDVAKHLSRYDVGAVYADPPYTRDQYSRFYHVYETLHLYDYPSSTGAGRYRSDRFVTPFSHVTTAKESFEKLFDLIAKAQIPLVLSYPAKGLLEIRDGPVCDLLGDRFSSVTNTRIDHYHSTLGASNGQRSKPTRENLYVCIP